MRLKDYIAGIVVGNPGYDGRVTVARNCDDFVTVSSKQEAERLSELVSSLSESVWWLFERLGDDDKERFRLMLLNRNEVP